MRLNRPSAAATAREPHAARTPREHQKWFSHGARETCGLRAAAAADGRQHCMDCVIATIALNSIHCVDGIE
eukprot:6172088-Lingulodinium_polyedra.AAC.1